MANWTTNSTSTIWITTTGGGGGGGGTSVHPHHTQWVAAVDRSAELERRMLAIELQLALLSEKLTVAIDKLNEVSRGG